MTHPGVGPLTSLSFALTIGEVERFRRSRQLSSLLRSRADYGELLAQLVRLRGSSSSAVMEAVDPSRR